MCTWFEEFYEVLCTHSWVTSFNNNFTYMFVLKLFGKCSSCYEKGVWVEIAITIAVAVQLHVPRGSIMDVTVCHDDDSSRLY